MRQPSISLAIVATLATLGCKPMGQDASQIQSLDNLTREENAAIATNSCGPARATKRFAAVKLSSSALDAPLQAALSAVPENLALTYFSAGVKGSVEVTASATSVCQNSFATAAERSFATEGGGGSPKVCWRKQPGSGPAIVVANDEKTIRHGILRAMAFVYDELLVASIKKSAASMSGAQLATVQTALSQYDQKKKALARALLQDLQANKQKSAVLAKLQAFAAQDPNSFSKIVLAEAVDSYYCSAATHAGFRSQFPTTYAVFIGKPEGYNGVVPESFAADFGRPWFVN